MQLLPPQETVKIHREYHARLAVVALGLFAVTLFLGVLFLSPAYFLSSQREDASVGSARALKDSVALRNKNDLAPSIALAKNKLNALADANAGVPANELIATALRKQGAGIHLTLLSVSRAAAEGGGRTLLVSGTADNRDVLLAFRRAVSGEKVFASVEVPVSDFAKDAALPFSLHATVK